MQDERLIKDPKQALKIVNQLLNLNESLQEEVDKYKYDDLTGLELRKDHNEKLKHMFKMFTKYNDNFSYALLDIDGLHDVNRNEDYQMGDVYIKTVVSDLKTHFPNFNIYRIGGDEFAIIKNGASGEELENGLSKINNITYGINCTNKDTTCKTWEDVLKITDRVVIERKAKKKRRSRDRDFLTQNELIKEAISLVNKHKKLNDKHIDMITNFIKEIEDI